MRGVRRVTVALAIAVGLAAGGVVAASAPVAADTPPAADGSIRTVQDPIPDQFVVTLKGPDRGGLTPVEADSLARRHNGQVLDVYSHALQGFAVRMSDDDARALATDPAVASVEQDGVVHTMTTQSPTPSWGLDRIDQRNLPLNNSYTYTGDGTGVHAYVIDTGIRITNTDFGGRASVGVDEVGDGSGPGCESSPSSKAGHGTHVAGTIGGTTYGVAKNVTLVSVRVLNCSGSGAFSQVVAGVDWVTANAIKPAVANMSLGGGSSASLDAAVSNSIASGVTYAIAAGNSGANACSSSPADVTAALTVGATTTSDSRDTSYSNFGSCLDLFAPGTGITSDWNTSDVATNTISGTSMATPHVAGTVARYLATVPCASPDAVAYAIVVNATDNKVTNQGSGSPTRLLYSGFLGANSAPVPPCAGPNLTVTAGYNTAHLGWDIPSDGGSPITGYAIYRSTSPGGEGVVPLATVSGVNSTSYDDATAMGGTTYYYQVAAMNAGGETRSAERSVTPLTPTAPAAPVVTATGGNKNVHLAWPLPNDGGSPLTGFVVSRGTSSGTETTLTTLAANATSFDDSPLTNGTTYFYKVTAQNGVGNTVSTEVSATPSTSQGAYFPLTPARIMDSRTGNGTPLAPFTTKVNRTLQVTGHGGVPMSGVAAVVMNVTVTNPTIASHVTVWPSGSTPPTASNLNFVAGQTEPNLVTVGVSGTGTVNLVLDNGSADLIADVVGYYGDGTGFGASGARYKPQSPYRILDSRVGTGGFSSPWGAGTTRDLTLPFVPNDATAVVLNVTATNPTAAGFATLWPSGLTRPNPASNLNVVPGQTVPNLVIVGIGANRKVSLYNSAGTTDFVADVVGWYGGTTATKLFTPASAPTRLLDSRVGTGFSTPWGADVTRDLTIAGSGPVPADATAVVMNVTATNPTAAGFATVFPAGGIFPNPASNLNFVPGQTVPNLTMVQIGDNGKVSFYNSAGSTDLIADVVGWFR